MPCSPMTTVISAHSTIVKALKKLVPTKDSKYFTEEGDRRPTDTWTKMQGNANHNHREIALPINYKGDN